MERQLPFSANANVLHAMVYHSPLRDQLNAWCIYCLQKQTCQDQLPQPLHKFHLGNRHYSCRQALLKGLMILSNQQGNALFLADLPGSCSHAGIAALHFHATAQQGVAPENSPHAITSWHHPLPYCHCSAVSVKDSSPIAELLSPNDNLQASARGRLCDAAPSLHINVQHNRCSTTTVQYISQ